MRLIPVSLALTVLCFAGSAAAAPRTAVILVDLNKAPGAPAGLESAVVKQVIAGFTSGGLSLAPVDDAASTARLAGCHDLMCSAAAASTAHAAYAVTLSIESAKPERGQKGKEHKVTLLAVPSGDQGQRWFEKSQCSDCDLDEAKQLAYLLSVEVGRQIITYETDLAKQVASAPKPSAAPSQAATPVATTSAPAVIVENPPAPPAPTMRWWVPWTLGVGAATLGTGVVLVGIGKQSGCPSAPYDECRKTRDFGPSGYLVGGIGLAVIGTAALGYFLPPSHGTQPSVALGPTGLSLLGRF
jgi:hypothetical protein